MDSLTQIVLGAAVGEVALGKKIGNRAMIWGAIGGTIPDLDVIGNAFLNEFDALAFHRGLSHSIFFSLVAPFVFAALTQTLYNKKIYQTRYYKTFLSIILILILGSAVWGVQVLTATGGQIHWIALPLAAILALGLSYRLYTKYYKKELSTVHTTYKDWYLLFFLAFITHIALDSFTGYGTQIFQPFHNYRAAFNNISIVDPFYTVPFLICLIVAATKPITSRFRSKWNWAGIIISTTYILLTLGIKYHVNSVFQDILSSKGISYTRMQTTPTIFNSVLWSCTAEDVRNFYIGQYSLLDSRPEQNLINQIPKQPELLKTFEPYHEFQVIKWFSNGYLTAFPSDSAVYLCDLRYGGLSDTITNQKDLIFYFKAKPTGNGYSFSQSREAPDEDMKTLFKKLFTRIKGN